MAPRAEGSEFPDAFTVHNALGHDAARRVAGAEEQDVENALVHYFASLTMGDSLPGLVYDDLAIVLCERSDVRIRQDIQDYFRGPA